MATAAPSGTATQSKHGNDPLPDLVDTDPQPSTLLFAERDDIITTESSKLLYTR